MTIRVFLIDDHQLVLEGLRVLLETRAHVQVVGTANSLHGAMEHHMCDAPPDVVITELPLNEPAGIEGLRRVHERCPHAKLLVLSSYLSTDQVAQAMQAGVNGYVSKFDGSHELIDAIHRVSAGGRYLSRELSLTLSNAYISDQLSANPMQLLSAREREVLQLVAQGASSPTIAHQLGLSTNTVDTYRSRLKTKLGIDTTADLVKFAIRNQLIAVE
jgi:DNA-binding NarL/FixJ family response regulator